MDEAEGVAGLVGGDADESLSEEFFSSCPGPEAVSGDAAGFSSEAAETEDAPVAMFAVGAGDVLVGEADDFGEFGV